jgi:hypothetical protein
LDVECKARVDRRVPRLDQFELERARVQLIVEAVIVLPDDPIAEHFLPAGSVSVVAVCFCVGKLRFLRDRGLCQNGWLGKLLNRFECRDGSVLKTLCEGFNLIFYAFYALFESQTTSDLMNGYRGSQSI